MNQDQATTGVGDTLVGPIRVSGSCSDCGPKRIQIGRRNRIGDSGLAKATIIGYSRHAAGNQIGLSCRTDISQLTLIMRIMTIHAANPPCPVVV